MVLIIQIFAKKADLDDIKSDADKLDFDKLETTPVNWSKLSNEVKNDVFKRTEYYKLVKKGKANKLLILAI